MQPDVPVAWSGSVEAFWFVLLRHSKKKTKNELGKVKSGLAEQLVELHEYSV